MYLTRDLHSSNNGSPVVSGAILTEKPFLCCLINFSHGLKQVYKNFFEQKPKNNTLRIVSCVAVVLQV